MIEPLNNYLLIEVEKEEEKTAGGLYIPQGSNANAVEILKIGKVVGVSEKAEEKLKVKKGDNINYNKHSLTKIPGNTEVAFVRLEDVYGLES